MGQTDRQRQYSALAVRGDGTRMPVNLPQPVAVSLLGKLEDSILDSTAKEEPAIYGEAVQPAYLALTVSRSTRAYS